MRSGEVPQLDVRLVSQLFVRMQSIYGHLWSSRFASAQMLEAAKIEWGVSLARHDVAAVWRAVEACKGEFDKPPTLPEFLRLCRPVPDAHRPYLALPCLPSSAEVAMAGLADVRARLSGRGGRG